MQVETWNAAELVRKDVRHHLHPLSNLHQLRQQGPLVLVRGEGVWVWDADGHRYLDGFAGLWNVNIGHGRTELAEAARAQMERIALRRPSSVS